MICPICSKDSIHKYKPFCSKRCADIDLAKWLSGSYAIPSTSEDDPEDTPRALEDTPNQTH